MAPPSSGTSVTSFPILRSSFATIVLVMRLPVQSATLSVMGLVDSPAVGALSATRPQASDSATIAAPNTRIREDGEDGEDGAKAGHVEPAVEAVKAVTAVACWAAANIC